MNNVTFSRQHSAIIKGIAVLLMIWHHALIPQFYISPDAILNNWGVIHLCMGGKFCVGLFTFIIGYGYACCNDHRFYSLRHIFRLMKQYWLLCLIVFFPIGIVFGAGDLFNWKTIINNLCGLEFQYNCASWFVFFYVYAMLAIIPLSRLAGKYPYFALLSSVLIFGISATLVPEQANIWLGAFHRCSFYTPVLVVGYVASKEQWIDYIPDYQPRTYLLIALLTLAARCFFASVKGFSTDTLFVPMFVLSFVAYLNYSKDSCGTIKKGLERLGEVSMYMWFLHALFFSDYTKPLFQMNSLWINKPFFSFILVSVMSYLFAELMVLFRDKFLSKDYIL